MADLWLVQYLCPQRHAICAAPYERPADTAAEIESKLLAEMHRHGLNPWCGLCGSRDLHFEHGKLAVTNWDDALRLLKETEAANIATRAFLDHGRQQN